MKKFVFILVILFLITIPLASATPLIENVSVQPSSLWLGENAIISLNCIDENNTIEQVYADITGPDIALPRMYFTKSGGKYTLTVNKEYLDRTGVFDVTISCKNNNSEITFSSTSFTVSRFTGSINEINPNPAFIGDIIEIDFIAKKDDIKLSSDVSFNVSLNNQLKNLKVHPAYDTNKGWILKIDSPSKADIYNLKVTAFYDRTSVSDYDTIDIRNKIEFEIVSISKDWIKPNDNITVKLKALEKGSVIELNKNNVDIKIGSANAEITSVSRQDDLFNAKITAPSLSSGKYQLEAYLSHDGSSYSDSISIDYIVTVKGRIVDDNNKGLSVQVKFIQNDVIKLNAITDAYGHYSGSIPPDIYNLEIVFPKSTINLEDVSINVFDDPINYFYSDEVDVPGIRNAGLYAYEIDLSYFDVEIEMEYKEKNVINENNLKIFKCSNWNSGRKICNSDWEEIAGEIDIIRNKIKLTSSTLSAFVIGEIKGLDVDFSTDKEKYYLGDTIKVRGIVKDEDRKTVSNASVSVYIENTGIGSDIVTDDNGVFSLEFLAPENEGEYIVVLSSKKHPYKDFKGEKDFEIVKSRSILIDFPDTVKIARGENFTQEFSLVNNGQADIDNIRIFLEGVPENYYNIVSDNIDLGADERKTLNINFFIPVYAEPGISSVSLKVEDGNISEEKVFGLNIFEKTKENETAAAPTGYAPAFTLPEISYMEIFYIVIVAAVCFSVAIILKKKKVSKQKRGKVKSFLFDIKNFLGKEETQIQESKPSENVQKSYYDKIIATEFPNFLKFSEKLKKTKGDKNGKDN